MRVIIDNHAYGMSKTEFKGLLKVASKRIQFGIYAVEKDGIAELKKEKFEKKDNLNERKKIMRSADLRFIGIGARNNGNQTKTYLHGR